MTEPCSIEDLRLAARRKLPRALFDFFDGGAEDEVTLRANRSAFQVWRFRPQVLRDVSAVNTQTQLFGRSMAMPMATAPTGALGYGQPGADLAIAQAAAAAGIPYILSSTATASLERIASAVQGRLWFQPYTLKDRDFFTGLIRRALAADFEALVITVDLPVGGKRERDRRNHFSVPFRFTAHNLMDFASKPVWCWQMWRQPFPVMENLLGLDQNESTISASAMASSVGRNHDTAFDWDMLKKVRDIWPRPLLLKGVLHPEDAKRACKIGCDALVVSNHGGRQLDGAVASMDALPEVLQAVDGRIPVWMDGGIRRGQDVVKALALGAQGVLIGRAMVYGAMAGGQAGAHRALALLHDELIRTMQLCGLSSLSDIGPELLVQAASHGECAAMHAMGSLKK
ncbi:MAG: alpha-hydroxy-acid oxidizing protein [Betaproteobacteria bacterium]|nr:alpha-hydroxy-acid oxidizing protein [Betaproteobacteria bacterium]NBY06329.1 alpha-hydroxy-acid oxidizing protein [Betaproteobacteria bacterium]